MINKISVDSTRPHDTTSLRAEGFSVGASNVGRLIGNLSSNCQMKIWNEIRNNSTLDFPKNQEVLVSDLSWLLAEEPSYVLSPKFGIDILTHLSRGAISLEEAGEIFQLRGVIASIFGNEQESVELSVFNPSSSDSSHLSMLTVEQREELGKLIDELPEERRVVINYTTGLIDNHDVSIDRLSFDQRSLYFICQPLHMMGEKWISINQSIVERIEILPFGIYNAYNQVRYGESSLKLFPEFGLTDSDLLRDQILLGKQAVAVANPFEKDPIADGGVQGAVPLMIHDLYHHCKRAMLSPDLRKTLILFGNDCKAP